MRTNEERITALHRRTEQLARARKDRHFAAFCGGSAAVCIALLAGIALGMPKFSGAALEGASAAGMNASIFSGSESLGYIVIAILAFLLGITVTVFCFRLKKYQDEKDRDGHR